MLRGARAEIPLHPKEQNVVMQVNPLQPMECTGGADMLQTAARGVPGWRKWLCHKGSCRPSGAHTGLLACRELILSSLKDCTLCKESMLGYCMNSFCWKTVWGGRRSRDEMLLWTDHSHHSLSHCTTAERGMKEGS